MEARDLTEVGIRMGWLSSWRRVAVETALFFFLSSRQTVRQTGTRGLNAECVNMKGVCGYEMAATTPTQTHTHTHTIVCFTLYRGMVQEGYNAVHKKEMKRRMV